MNANNAKDYLPLVQALADGLVIQGKMQNDVWVDCVEPSFLSHHDLYRIKPEPKEIFVVNDDDDLAYFDERRAKNVAGGAYGITRYREVIE